MNLALLVNPGKPSLLICREFFVKTNPARDIGSILVLNFQTLFHICQMNQVQHLTPVNLMLLFNGLDSIFDGTFYKLHLFNLILY